MSTYSKCTLVYYLALDAPSFSYDSLILKDTNDLYFILEISLGSVQSEASLDSQLYKLNSF